jgi:hypothetical protein
VRDFICASHNGWHSDRFLDKDSMSQSLQA